MHRSNSNRRPSSRPRGEASARRGPPSDDDNNHKTKMKSNGSSSPRNDTKRTPSSHHGRKSVSGNGRVSSSARVARRSDSSSHRSKHNSIGNSVSPPPRGGRSISRCRASSTGKSEATPFSSTEHLSGSIRSYHRRPSSSTTRRSSISSPPPTPRGRSSSAHRRQSFTTSKSSQEERTSSAERRKQYCVSPAPRRSRSISRSISRRRSSLLSLNKDHDGESKSNKNTSPSQRKEKSSSSGAADYVDKLLAQSKTKKNGEVDLDKVLDALIVANQYLPPPPRNDSRGRATCRRNDEDYVHSWQDTKVNQERADSRPRSRSRGDDAPRSNSTGRGGLLVRSKSNPTFTTKSSLGASSTSESCYSGNTPGWAPPPPPKAVSRAMPMSSNDLRSTPPHPPPPPRFKHGPTRRVSFFEADNSTFTTKSSSGASSSESCYSGATPGWAPPPPPQAVSKANMSVSSKDLRWPPPPPPPPPPRFPTRRVSFEAGNTRDNIASLNSSCPALNYHGEHSTGVASNASRSAPSTPRSPACSIQAPPCMKSHESMIPTVPALSCGSSVQVPSTMCTALVPRQDIEDTAATIKSGNSKNTKVLLKERSPRKSSTVTQMTYTDPYGDSGVYTGDVDSNNIPHGKGKMKYDNGIYYEGNWINGCKDEAQCRGADAMSTMGGASVSGGMGASAFSQNQTRERILSGFTSWKGQKCKDSDGADTGTFVYGLQWVDHSGLSGKYTGHVNKEEIPDGRGVMRYDFGLVAEGEWIKGVLNNAGGGSGVVNPALAAGAGGMSVGPGMSIAAGGGAMSVVSGLGMVSIGGGGGMMGMNRGMPSQLYPQFINTTPAASVAGAYYQPPGAPYQQQGTQQR